MVPTDGVLLQLWYPHVAGKDAAVPRYSPLIILVHAMGQLRSLAMTLPKIAIGTEFMQQLHSGADNVDWCAAAHPVR